MKLCQKIASILSAVLFIEYTITTAEVCVRYDYGFNTTTNITYHICNIKKQFDDSRAYCRNLASAPGSSLVKFYNEEIFKGTLQIMRSYSNGMSLPDLTIFIGLEQCPGNDPLVAYSGSFCWLQDEVNNNCGCTGNEINSESTTYYAPVNDWILNFTALTISQKSMRTFTMDKNGNWLSGDTINTGFPTYATIMCQKLVTGTTISVKFQWLYLWVGCSVFAILCAAFIIFIVVVKCKQHPPFWVKRCCNRKRRIHP